MMSRDDLEAIELERAKLALEKERLEVNRLRRIQEASHRKNRVLREGVALTSEVSWGLFYIALFLSKLFLGGAICVGSFIFLLFEPLYAIYVAYTNSNPLGIFLTSGVPLDFFHATPVHPRAELSFQDAMKILVGLNGIIWGAVLVVIAYKGIDKDFAKVN